MGRGPIKGTELRGPRTFVPGAEYGPSVGNLGRGAGTGTVVTALPAQGVMSITFDGSGSVPSAGKTVDIPYFPFAMELLSATIEGDVAGSAVIDIYVVPYASAPGTSANSICGATKPTLASQQKNQDTVLAGWSKLIAAGSNGRFHLDSAAVLTAVTLGIAWRRVLVS